MTDSFQHDHDPSAPAFRIVPGDPRSRTIIHVPHASRAIPDAVRAGISLDDAALGRELDAMTDAFTDAIADRVAARTPLRPWVFVNDFSRLVIDPERFPADERKETNAAGMAAVHTWTSDGFVLRNPSDDEFSGLVIRYFEPYTSAFTDLVEQRLHAAGEVTIIDLHSFALQPLPYELHDDGPRPEVCLGTDKHHTPPDLIESAHETFASFEVGLDTPFAGTYVPPAHYGQRDEVQALTVALRRDLYIDEASFVEPATEPIIEALRTLLATIDPRVDAMA